MPITNPCLRALAYVALVTEVPPANHAWRAEPAAETEARYAALAAAIAEVSATMEEASLLAVTAAAESAVRRDVLRCVAWGDGGPRAKAWGAFGIVAPKAQACGDLVAQATLARDLLRRSAEACAALPPRHRLAWYLSGSCSRGRAESARRWRRSERYAGLPCPLE